MQQHCPKYNVNTKQQYCPLCEYKLFEEPVENVYYPVYEMKPQRRGFVQHFILFIATFVISTSFVNQFTNGATSFMVLVCIRASPLWDVIG